MNKMLLTGSMMLALAAGGCTRTAPPPAAEKGHAEEAPAPTNRVAVPHAVRQNLGVTFAKVESRAVAQTLRAPGRFELLPDARREYRTMVAGQVEAAPAQFERVEPGAVMYRIRSPRWRELQQQISEAEAAITNARASAEMIVPLREAHHAHERALEETVALTSERVAQLEAVRAAGGGKADELAAARASLAAARADLAEVMEKDADLEAQQRGTAAALEAATSRHSLLLSTAAALTGLPVAEIGARWRTLDVIDVCAVAPGVVETVSLTPGAWAEESSLVITTVQPERLRFHAQGLQSDLGRLRDGLPALIVPPGGSLDAEGGMPGTVVLGISADPEHRTIDMYLTPSALTGWARPGVAAYMEVTLAGGQAELAVPRAAVVRDGLTPVLFRRDPKDADTVIRIDADLGVDDGRWVVIKSGLKAGDEVVLDGVYQLMLATSGNAAKGGHFHADGTFHEGEDK